MSAVSSPPSDLVQATHSGNCVVFVGSGISITSGAPSWEQVLTSLSAALFDERGGGSATREREREEERGDVRRMIMNENRLLDAAQYCVDSLTPRRFMLEIRRLFKSASVRPSSIHRLITQIPFCGVVTTNYDTLLEDAYADSFLLGQIEVVTQLDDLELSLISQENPFFILKAHGDARRASTLVLGWEGYRHLTSAESYRQLVRTLVSSKTLLFVGYGFRDPDINGLLENMREVSACICPHAYAVVADPSRVDVNTFQRRYGITTIEYTNPDGRHDGLGEFMSSLLRAVSGQGALPANHPYRKLVLRNTP